MLSNNDSTASIGTPETTPVDPSIHSTPMQSTAIPYSSGHIIRDEDLVELGYEMVGYVVGPMPAKDFLTLLPHNSRKPPSFNKEPFVELVDQPMETKIYNPFVHIPFNFLYP